MWLSFTVVNKYIHIIYVYMYMNDVYMGYTSRDSTIYAHIPNNNPTEYIHVYSTNHNYTVQQQRKIRELDVCNHHMCTYVLYALLYKFVYVYMYIVESA